MSIRHLWAVIRKEIQHILRDRGTFILVLVTPTLVLLLMTYALAVDIEHVPIALLDYDQSPISRQFVQQITAGDDLDLYTAAGSMEEIEDLLVKGKIKAALIIDPGFSADLLSMRGLSLQVVIDGTEPETGGFAVDHIGWRAETFANQILSRQLQASGLALESFQPIDLRIRAWYNPSLVPQVDLVPGLLSIVLGFPAFSVALTLAREHEHRTMEQLLATPITRIELLLGKIIPYILAGLFNVLVIPLFAMAWFNVPFHGSVLVFLLLSVIFLFAELSMGMVIGVFMRSQSAALALSFLVVLFPGFFLTGIFFPIASLPELARMESLFLPGTQYAIITRGVFLTGIGLDVLWPYAVMLIFLGLVFTGAAALFFKKEAGIRHESMIRRILALMNKEFLHLKNDWWLPAFMLFGGALELLMIGWATSRPISNLPLMIWDMDKTPASRNLVISIENTGTFELVEPATSMDVIENEMDRGNINAAVIIPRGFAGELSAYAGKPILQVILNGAESIPARESQRAIEGVVWALGEKITIEKLGVNAEQFEGFDFSLRVWFNEALNEAYFTTPAELALMLEFTILIFAALTFSREREFGTLEQLLVMPFTSLEIIIGKSIPVILVGLFDFSIMLGVVHFAFDVPVRGSLSLIYCLAFIYTLVELGKGMAISVFSRSQHQSFLLVLMVGMIDFMFTGYAAPVESMPRIIRILANFIPAHHWLAILRGIILKGSTIKDILPNVLWLLVLGSIIGFFSLRYIRKVLD